MRVRKINKEFFSRNAEEVARDLLGKILVRKTDNNLLKAKIIETEAYFGREDPASRAVQNGDLRKTMLMKPGTILVYGVHNNWLINFVTSDEGKAEAILIRSVEPLNFEAKTSGPGLLTKALKIGKEFHKKNVCENSELLVEENTRLDELKKENLEIVEASRIGLKKDLPKKLRFYIKGNKFVSKR